MVKVENGFKEIKLKGRLVKLLLDLNANRREDVSVDLTFIKALIVSVFTVKYIKEEGILQTELVDFIKGEKELFIFENIEIQYKLFL